MEITFLGAVGAGSAAAANVRSAMEPMSALVKRFYVAADKIELLTPVITVNLR